MNAQVQGVGYALAQRVRYLHHLRATAISKQSVTFVRFGEDDQITPCTEARHTLLKPAGDSAHLNVARVKVGVHIDPPALRK